MRVQQLAGFAVAVFLSGQFSFAQAPAARPSSPAQYPGMQPLTGQFDITGLNAIDPPPGEARDTHFRMHLTGDAAKAFFDHMKVDAKPPACDGSYRRGVREKRLGDITCSTDGQTYDCFMAINIQEQRIEGGWAC